MYFCIKIKLICFCLFISANIPGQTNPALLDLAEQFYKSGYYYESITEYKRYLFFNQENESIDKSAIYYKIGLSYRNSQKWKPAEKYLKKSITFAHNQYDKENRRIALSVIQISSKRYSAAKFGLLKLTMYSQYPDIKERAHFFFGICNLYEYNWHEAKLAYENYLKNCTNHKMILKKEIVLKLLDKAQSIRYKSPLLAKWLSTFLPGSGQIYAGDWLNGINALGINLATGAIVVDSLIKKNYKDALINYMVLFNRFYQGNKYHAQRLVWQYNEKLNRKILADILEILREDT